MNFQEWLYKVCEYKSNRSYKEITDIYSSIDLYDAKLAFLDNISPEDYKINN